MGRKWRDSGKIFQNIRAAASAEQPITIMAMRQPKKSVITPQIKRPLMPPMELPLI